LDHPHVIRPLNSPAFSSETRRKAKGWTEEYKQQR